MENWITLAEGAGLLGVSHEAIRRLCHRGTLAHVRKGGRLLVRRDEVLERRRRMDDASRARVR